MAAEDTLVDSFTEFVKLTEPRLRHSLSALFGTEAGKDLAADALVYGWEHWERVRDMDNPAGYLYSVGRDKGRRQLGRRRPVLVAVDPERMPWIEPHLVDALALLPERQRVVVMLLHCFQWSMSEVSDLLGLAKPTVQTHAQRGLDRLREQLGVDQ